MSDRLKIDNTIKEKSTDFYYSATDMYGVDVFTESYRETKELVANQYKEKTVNTVSVMFDGDNELQDSYETFATSMFMGKQYERKYRDYNNNNEIMLSFVLCILAGAFSLIMCAFITKFVKKKKDDINN